MTCTNQLVRSLCRRRLMIASAVSGLIGFRSVNSTSCRMKRHLPARSRLDGALLTLDLVRRTHVRVGTRLYQPALESNLAEIANEAGQVGFSVARWFRVLLLKHRREALAIDRSEVHASGLPDTWQPRLLVGVLASCLLGACGGGNERMPPFEALTHTTCEPPTAVSFENGKPIVKCDGGAVLYLQSSNPRVRVSGRVFDNTELAQRCAESHVSMEVWTLAPPSPANREILQLKCGGRLVVDYDRVATARNARSP